ncbi:MAG: DNA recombination protein RmuC [Lentisphaeraceae bacterium]|nr:DNA recombination protein RmuC [Lentisphaeraceae bacterium]
MDIVYFVVGIAIGSLLASCIWYFRSRSMLASKSSDLLVLEERLKNKEEQFVQVYATLEKSDKRIDELLDEKGVFRERLAELEVKLEEEKRQSIQRLADFESSKKQMKLEFQQLSHEILSKNTEKLTDQNQEKLKFLLSPLKEEIGQFKKKVEETYEKETRERHSLKTEITNLQKLNAQMSQETLNLTNALKGDVRSQGAWGELILERILESSGLQKGREYFVQSSHRTEDGQLQRPDVVVRLPDDKDVVIDSKVSLVAYEKYCSEDDLTLKKQFAKEHLLSVQNHIKGLSAKSYEDIAQLRTLDYVLLFMPMEGAFRLALEEDEGLLLEAMKKNVMLVGPSTLLVSLRTISKLWQYENQNQNTQAIAKKAEQLHRKFVLFVQEVQKVGDALSSAGKHYDEALKRLATGRGNLIKLSSDLEQLGVKPKESLPRELLEISEVNNEE